LSNVPTNLIPTRITGLPEYLGSSTLGYMPYIIDGRTYKVQFANIAAVGAVPSTREINTGSGLGGGGDLSANRTLFILPAGVDDSRLTTTGVTAATYGSAENVAVLTVNAQGRVTSATNTPIVLSNYVPTSRTITAGTGLTGGGDLSANRSFAVNFSSTTPEPLGPGSPGVSTVAAREDHVHPAVDLSDTTETQGVLPLSRGGTGNSLSPVVGAIAYSSNDKLYLTPTAGNAGQVLTSDGGGVPYWSTVTGVGTVTSVNLTAGTGISVSGGPITSAGSINVVNTAPDQIVSLTGAGTATVTGTYPNFTITSTGGTGTVTSVSGTGSVSGLSLSGTVTSAGSLTLGGTLVVTPSNFASQTANTVLAAPNGSAGVPTFRAIVAADIPTLNQNTTGTASNVTGVVAVANGGTGASIAATARSNLSAAASGANTDITSIALTTGTISTTPTSGTDIVNKAYADSIASGINFHQSVRLATAAALPANTYNNGTGGVGATLTANANGALSVDGVAVAAGNRILVKNEAAGANNGVYTVTQTGSSGGPGPGPGGSNPYILTRATDFDSAGTGVDQIDAGDFFLVTAGSTQSNTSWVQQTPLPIVVGTTAIVFTQFAAPVLYSAGTGLTLAGTVFSITNTGVSAATYGSASSVPVVAVNAQGQATSVTNTPIAIAASQITSGVLPAANGGTGLSSPGTSGNVLTSNGTAWVSQLPAAGGITYTAVKTSNYTAAANEGVQTDTSGGAFTVTLPATPSVGDQVFVTDSGGAWATNNLTIGRNGLTIDGSATDLICDISSVSVQLIYSGTTWDVFAQVGGAGAGVVSVAGGGTGATTAGGARTNLGAAASGANTDITALDQDVTITATGTIAADTIGYRGLPQNSQTASYTLALDDAGKHISITTGGVIIPANGSVAFPIGTTIVVFNNSASTQTISITTDTLRQAGTTNTGTRTLAVYGLATLVKMTSTVWVVTGNVT
jgi:hypothetical protein